MTTNNLIALAKAGDMILSFLKSWFIKAKYRSKLACWRLSLTTVKAWYKMSKLFSYQSFITIIQDSRSYSNNKNESTI